MTAYSLGPLLYEGKAKRVYATDQPDLVAVEFKDDATAFNAEKRASLAGKGERRRTKRGDQELWGRTVCWPDCKGECCCSVPRAH